MKHDRLLATEELEDLHTSRRVLDRVAAIAAIEWATETGFELHIAANSRIPLEHEEVVVLKARAEALQHTPHRLRMSRARGWHKPDGAVYVGSPSRWKNPFKPAGPTATDKTAAVDRYRTWLATPEGHAIVLAARRELAGRDLLCWCFPEDPCHADELIKVANT